MQNIYSEFADAWLDHKLASDGTSAARRTWRPQAADDE
jgi:hypothetical protein